MASAQAQRSARAFMGGDQQLSSFSQYTRHPLGDVPQNDDGLRIYAAHGDWASVVSLADKLEDEVAAKANASDKVSGSSSGAAIPQHMAARAARLPYALVQATAYLRMQRPVSAKEVLDAFGDIEGDAYHYPGTTESFAPFSLRFVSAMLPVYLGAPAEAQRRLHVLLFECEQALAGEVKAQSLHQTYSKRAQRVLRALVHVHFTAGQYPLAITLFQQLMELEEKNETAGKEKEQEKEEVCRALRLQQFACLCLQCGNTFLADEAFVKQQQLQESSSSDMVMLVHQYMQGLNDAFALVFKGLFTEAAEQFRTIAEQVGATLEKTGTATGVVNDALLQVRTQAQVSHVTCLPYTDPNSENPMHLMSSITATMQEYIKDSPHTLLTSGAFVKDAVRYYILSGDQKQRLEQLADLLELFQCDRICIPPLDTMM